ncbi:MAG TPA: hypothetical protein VE954_22040 [Oligoflexus sp.]|uniref:hypothetical protein n=1 Tax=Oligoflexus sp. TaxID=1971216 RepID=UPI002D426E00|nr:hypothetical protein [Oligoflexus sp.]HYX35788.1 hypothetical protein [Oligoflexus sp.]
MVLKGLALFAFTTLLSSCGKDSNDKDKAPAQNAPPVASIPLGLTSTSDNPELLGSWSTECKACGYSYCQTKLEMQAELLIWNKNQFADLSCSKELLQIRHIGPYTAEDGGIDSVLTQTHMKIENEDFKTAAEQSLSCGFNSWPLKTWLDVTGRNCPATREKGGVWSNLTVPGKALVHAAYVLEGDHLTLEFSDGVIVLSKESQ